MVALMAEARAEAMVAMTEAVRVAVRAAARAAATAEEAAEVARAQQQQQAATIRRNQKPSDAIRRNLTQSKAAGLHVIFAQVCQSRHGPT